MKTLVLKELREHFKVALVAFIIFTVICVLAFSACTSALRQLVLSNGYLEAEQLHPLLSSSLWTQAAFFCAIFGTVLGFLQIRAESHPDLWAFLIHRPVTRGTILRSKLLSGGLLYVAGAGLPLLGLILVVSRPGHLAAPFEWAMTLPLVAIFLVGPAFYLGGLVTALRKARWYGSRTFAMGPAVIAILAIFAVTEFWQALLVIVGAAALLTLAAWGSFKTGGYYREQPLPGKIALSVAGTVSVTLLIGLGIVLAFNLLWPDAEYSNAQYQVTRNGDVIKVTYHSTSRAIEGTEITDLEGKPVLDNKGQKIKFKEIRERFAPGLTARVDFGESGRRADRPRYSSVTRFFHPWRVVDKTLWYLTADGQLVAYDGVTRRWADRLQPPDDSRFLRPFDYWNQSFYPYQTPGVLASARTAYLADLEKRELTPLFTTTNGDAIAAYATASSAPSNGVLIISRAAVRLMNFAGALRLQVPYEPSYPNYSSVSVLLLEPANTFAVRFDPDYWLNEKTGGKLLSHVKWVNPDGAIRKEMDLPKLPEMERHAIVEQVATALLPPVVPIYPGEPPLRVMNIVRLVIAVGSAFLGVWLARRNNFHRRAMFGWGIFLLLSGVPGLLAFLAVQEWPAKEPCSHCQEPRVVDRETCEHCGAAFPPPKTVGTEIFEALTASETALADGSLPA